MLSLDELLKSSDLGGSPIDDSMSNFRNASSSTYKQEYPAKHPMRMCFRIDDDFESGQSIKRFMKSCRVKN